MGRLGKEEEDGQDEEEEEAGAEDEAARRNRPGTGAATHLPASPLDLIPTSGPTRSSSSR